MPTRKLLIFASAVLILSSMNLGTDRGEASLRGSLFP